MSANLESTEPPWPPMNLLLSNIAMAVVGLGAAVLATGGGRGHVFISAVSLLSFSFPLVFSIFAIFSALFLPFSGRWHKMTLKADKSLNNNRTLSNIYM